MSPPCARPVATLLCCNHRFLSIKIYDLRRSQTGEYKGNSSEDDAAEPEHEAGQYRVLREEVGRRRRRRPQVVSLSSGERRVRKSVNPDVTVVATIGSPADTVRRRMFVSRRRSGRHCRSLVTAQQSRSTYTCMNDKI